MKIALVIPWFGKDLKGGAEQHAWQIVSRLNQRDVDIEVLTTCSKEFLSDWSENHYKEGEYYEDSILIRRFSLNRKRSNEKFHSANAQLLEKTKQGLLSPGVFPVSKENERDYIENNIYSETLQNYIINKSDNYDLFLFIPYLFPNSIKGVQVVSEKAICIPCLHDESYAYMESVQKNFLQAKRLFFNSRGEYELALKLYGPSIIGKARVLYGGIETDISESYKYDRFLLCLGRRDKGKNTHILIQAFEKYLDVSGSDLKLVIAGPGEIPIEYKSKNIIDRGLITEEEKTDLLSRCLLLVNPSENESFSRVIYEAWLNKKPVLINKKSIATYYALQDSGFAGFHASGIDSFIEVFSEIDKMDESELSELGCKGLIYAREIANWDNVIDNYIKEMKSSIQKRVNTLNYNCKRNICIVTPDLYYGDAVSFQVLTMKKLMLDMGIQCKIFANNIGDKVKEEGSIYKPGCLNGADAVIYHHSIYFKHLKDVLSFKGKKVLIYHNITPADFFEKYNPLLADLVQKGRNQLDSIVKNMDVYYADSEFNLQELYNRGLAAGKKLPLIVSYEKWEMEPDQDMLSRLMDGRPNILFTGRIAPNKCQIEILEVIRYLRILNPEIRMVLAGILGTDQYGHSVSSKITEWGLEDNILVLGHVTDEQLKSCYMASDLYFSLSEHEGFGVPLIESMWYDIPVFAYKSTAVPETLSESAFLLSDKRDKRFIAAAIHEILQNKDLQETIVNAQRKVRNQYSYSSVLPLYEEMIKNLCCSDNSKTF